MSTDTSSRLLAETVTCAGIHTKGCVISILSFFLTTHPKHPTTETSKEVQVTTVLQRALQRETWAPVTQRFGFAEAAHVLRQLLEIIVLVSPSYCEAAGSGDNVQRVLCCLNSCEQHDDAWMQLRSSDEVRFKTPARRSC